MSENDTGFRPVKTLVPEVARKIAAGEVIDRPCAVLREFLDNAVDAGASRITAEIELGGTSLIRVADNGCGMTKEDVELCALPHATSKIVSDGDLEHLTTLGFRGEALASIAAVSRLEITACRGGQAWHLETGPDGRQFISPASLPAGTVAVCRGLFENFPARHRFLKRAQAETALCKQVFIDKSLPFPDRAFRLVCDSKIRFDFPAGQTPVQRFCSALEMNENLPLFYEIRSHGGKNSAEKPAENNVPQGAGAAAVSPAPPAWSFSIILGESGMYRSDRKLMYVFVNGRRVQEYALLQAIDYGAEGYFPNGTHPIACLFLNIDSSLVDFNIHPAKKEVRFKDIGPIHHGISSAVRNFYRDLSVHALSRENVNEAAVKMSSDPMRFSKSSGAIRAEPRNTALYGDFFNDGFFGSGKACEREHASGYADYTGSANGARSLAEAAFFNADRRTQIGDKAGENAAYDTAEVTDSAESAGTSAANNLRFIGSALGVFLIAEKDGDLYLVDQHAGHERLLFERFLETAGEKQALLVPLVIETASEDDDRYLESLVPSLHKAGFTMKNCGSGRWEVESVPIKWHGTERDLQKDFL
ncbi:MAG: DNA mismatch repair endonuclease MutL, partial [Treponema maltophilum]